MDMNQFPGPSEEWLKRMDEIESTCLSVAVGGLASRLGMIDRDQVRQYRAATVAQAAARAEASGSSPLAK